MRGISAVVVVVLILMILVTIASAAFVWFKSLYGAATAVGEAEAERLTTTGKALMKIEGKTDKIYIRNIGDTNLSDFKVYMNDIPIDYEIDKETLAPGQVAEIIPDISYYTEGSKVKITTAQGLVAESAYEISFYGEEYSIDTGGAGEEIMPLSSEIFGSFVLEANVNMIKSYSPGFLAIGIRKTNKDDPIFSSGYDVYYDNSSEVAVYKANKRDNIAAHYSAPPLTQPRKIKIIAGAPFDDGTREAPKTNISVYIDGIKFIDFTDYKQSTTTGHCSCRKCFKNPLTGRCEDCPCDRGCFCQQCVSCRYLTTTTYYPIYESGYISLEASNAHVHFSDIKIIRT